MVGCAVPAAGFLSLQVVQLLTVDYGKEFCDFYEARCNRQMIETCRVKAVDEIPSSVKMDWVEHKLPIAPKGYQEPAAAASTGSTAAASPVKAATSSSQATALPSFF